VSPQRERGSEKDSENNRSCRTVRSKDSCPIDSDIQIKNAKKGSVAEWSKALDLSIFT
jgi:hypothetical protein